jgi:hypothetical protein
MKEYAILVTLILYKAYRPKAPHTLSKHTLHHQLRMQISNPGPINKEDRKRLLSIDYNGLETLDNDCNER